MKVTQTNGKTTKIPMSDEETAASDGQPDDEISRPDANDRWLILNPTSGTADHIDRVRRLAADQGYMIRETDCHTMSEESDSTSSTAETSPWPPFVAIGLAISEVGVHDCFDEGFECVFVTANVVTALEVVGCDVT